MTSITALELNLTNKVVNPQVTLQKIMAFGGKKKGTFCAFPMVDYGPSMLQNLLQSMSFTSLNIEKNAVAGFTDDITRTVAGSTLSTRPENGGIHPQGPFSDNILMDYFLRLSRKFRLVQLSYEAATPNLVSGRGTILLMPLESPDLHSLLIAEFIRSAHKIYQEGYYTHLLYVESFQGNCAFFFEGEAEALRTINYRCFELGGEVLGSIL